MTSTFPRINAPGMHRGIGALFSAGALQRQPVLLVS
jgi:hypothetical protein